MAIPVLVTLFSVLLQEKNRTILSVKISKNFFPEANLMEFPLLFFHRETKKNLSTAAIIS